METPAVPTAFRVTFNDYRQDPNDSDVRARYPRMGQPWPQEDDTHLLALYQQGERDLETLGKQFDRKPSAIRSRLAKLGLEGLC
ncbi:hypothetical protein ACFWVP_12905 [Streptomyces sp. NPDC058637]|uniref:hypothetical protein n=1 Tax=Streptomyces sp. NPDC058637 TaxID=3346569 RepID=UPI00365C90C1